MLKIVEIVIILVPEGDMKQQVLKALANPSRIFYVPYSLAILNFVVQFIVFMAIFLIGFIFTKGDVAINPMYFMISVIVVHSVLAVFSKRDPQLGQIVSAKVQLFKRKIPGKLAA